MKPTRRREETKDRGASVSKSSPDPDRADPDEALAAAIKLCENLAIANQLSVGRSDRVRAAAALAFVITFILRVDQRGGLLTPLIKLRNALYDLEQGVMSPMFKVNRSGGRDPDPIGRKMVKGAAAASMSLLMDVGLNRQEAAKRVAGVLQHAGMALGNRSWRTVASWRDQAAKKAKSKNDNPFPGWHWYFKWTTAHQPPVAGELEREEFCKDLLASLESVVRYDAAASVSK